MALPEVLGTWIGRQPAVIFWVAVLHTLVSPRICPQMAKKKIMYLQGSGSAISSGDLKLGSVHYRIRGHWYMIVTLRYSQSMGADSPPDSRTHSIFPSGILPLLLYLSLRSPRFIILFL